MRNRFSVDTILFSIVLCIFTAAHFTDNRTRGSGEWLMFPLTPLLLRPPFLVLGHNAAFLFKLKTTPTSDSSHYEFV